MQNQSNCGITFDTQLKSALYHVIIVSGITDSGSGITGANSELLQRSWEFNVNVSPVHGLKILGIKISLKIKSYVSGITIQTRNM